MNKDKIDELAEALWSTLAYTETSINSILSELRKANKDMEQTTKQPYNVTKNGEIIYDPAEKVYKVNDETYSEYVCITRYKRVAYAAYEEYGKLLYDLETRAASKKPWEELGRIAGPIRGALREHDGSDDPPKWLDPDDEVLLEFKSGAKAVFQGTSFRWGHVRRYQLLEVE